MCFATWLNGASWGFIPLRIAIDHENTLSFIPLRIAIDHENALSEWGLEFGHIDLDRSERMMGERQLRDPARLDTPLDTLSGQYASDEVKFGFIKGGMDLFPNIIFR